MHDIEIERRLRLPAPDEPAVLAALVFPAEVDDRSSAVGTSPTAYAVSGRTRPRPLGGASAAMLVAAVVVLAVTMIAVLLPTRGEVGGRAPTPVSASSPSPSEAGGRPSGDVDGPIVPGRFEVPWPRGPEGGRIHVTVPEGWAAMGSGSMTIYKDAGRFYGFPVAIGVHTVSRVVTSMCAAPADSPEIGPTVAEVGPTIDDLATAITGIVGTRWSDPADVTVDGYPAKQMSTTYDASVCEGPPRRWIWADDGGWYFVEDGMTTTVRVVDVDGHRLVFTTEVRDASVDDQAQLDAIVASIQIDPPAAGTAHTSPQPTDGMDRFPMAMGPDADLRVGPHEAVVEGIPFEFGVPSRGWEPQRGFYISKSFVGGQAAEAIVRWTTYPDGRHTDPCPGLLSVDSLPTPEELAAAMASAPGVEPEVGPSVTIVGGRAAQHVVVRVVTHAGCDPGYFYAYEPVDGGALWTETRPRDTIMVWIVAVDGTLFVIEAQHRDDRPAVEEEIRHIVESVRLE